MVGWIPHGGFQLNYGGFLDKDTNVWQMISSYLKNKSHMDDHTIHLLFSANCWEKRFVMLFLCSFVVIWFVGFMYISWNCLFVLILIIFFAFAYAYLKGRNKKKHWLLIINHMLSNVMNLKVLEDYGDGKHVQEQCFALFLKLTFPHCNLFITNLQN